MEKAGKPGAAIVSEGFEKDAAASARAFGFKGFRHALLPRVITGLTPAQIEHDVEGAIEQFVSLLTTDAPAEQSETPAEVLGDTLRYEGADSYAAAEAMNRDFLEREWGDGFPLIPPTRERVIAMLAGSTRQPQDVIAVMAPGNGIATVEKIAISAVMAGCESAHLPVLIAACEAYVALGRSRAMAMSTSPHAPLMLVNGPITQELGMNSRRCSLGPGRDSRVNIVLGRALRLMMINIGLCRPNHTDMDTIGSARKFSLCVAENEAQNPWQPYHVEKGFAASDSTVTLFATRDEVDVNDMSNWTPEGVMRSFAYFGAIPGGEYIAEAYPGKLAHHVHLLMFAPEHAAICANGGLDKAAVRAYVHEHCQTSALRLMNKPRNAPDKVRPQWKWLLEKSETELEQIKLPILQGPEQYEIVVVGGPVGKNLLFRCISQPATALIKDRAP